MSPGDGTRQLKRGGMTGPQVLLSIPPSRNTALTHSDLCDLLDGEIGEGKKIKIKTWSNLCILSAFSSWHRGVVLHVYYNLPNNTADNYYNFYF